MIAATVVHFMMFQFWPTQTAADVSFTAEELEMIELPPEIEIPPPPEAISRPATPVMATADIDDDITIAPTTFADNPIEDLPPPPTNNTAEDISAAPVFTPMTVRPGIRNRNEIQQVLMREYPPILRDAGIGGRVIVWFFISEEGRVLDRRVSETSGQVQLDQAALAVADVFRFTPALTGTKQSRFGFSFRLLSRSNNGWARRFLRRRPRRPGRRGRFSIGTPCLRDAIE